MTYFFKINLETPAKKNSRVINTKTGRSFPNKTFTQWHALALAEILKQKNKNMIPINTPVEIKLRFTHGDRRRRDSDNGVSSIFDLLTDARILEDDNWEIITRHTVENTYEKGAPSCFIVIRDCKPENYV